jgi:serine/threonine protein kinase
MCNGQLPFETEQEILDYNLTMKTTVSTEYKQLLFDCLKLDPDQRPKLADLLNYAWFHTADADDSLTTHMSVASPAENTSNGV